MLAGSCLAPGLSLMCQAVLGHVRAVGSRVNGRLVCQHLRRPRRGPVVEADGEPAAIVDPFGDEVEVDYYIGFCTTEALESDRCRKVEGDVVVGERNLVRPRCVVDSYKVDHFHVEKGRTAAERLHVVVLDQRRNREPTGVFQEGCRDTLIVGRVVEQLEVEPCNGGKTVRDRQHPVGLA